MSIWRGKGKDGDNIPYVMPGKQEKGQTMTKEEMHSIAKQIAIREINNSLPIEDGEYDDLKKLPTVQSTKAFAMILLHYASVRLLKSLGL